MPISLMRSLTPPTTLLRFSSATFLRSAILLSTMVLYAVLRILVRTLETVSATEAPFLSSPILVRVISGSFAVVLVISAAALAATEISPPRTTSFLMMTFFPPLSFSAEEVCFSCALTSFCSAFSAEAVFFLMFSRSWERLFCVSDRIS